MKYLNYILTLALIACLLGIWSSSSSQSVKQEDSSSLIINDHLITADEIKSRRENSSYYVKEQHDFIEDLITKELLIQEAQSQKIDNEESFRLALKDYYEQSLIKVLIDRQYKLISRQLKENDIIAFKNTYVSHYRLDIHQYPTLAAAVKLQSADTQQLSSDYFDLPEDVRDIAVQLEAGEISDPVATDSQYIRILLVSKDTAATTAPLAEESVLHRCEEELLRQSMNKWLLGLRNSARISLPENL